MSFYPVKYVGIKMTSKRIVISGKYILHNRQLDMVDSSKYLGTTISNILKWDKHIDNITAKANRTSWNTISKGTEDQHVP